MNKKYHVYGIGNALVDMEFSVQDSFFTENGIDKGVMTLVDEPRQHQLIAQLDAFAGKKAPVHEDGGASRRCLYSFRLPACPLTHSYRTPSAPLPAAGWSRERRAS